MIQTKIVYVLLTSSQLSLIVYDGWITVYGVIKKIFLNRKTIYMYIYIYILKSKLHVKQC